MALVAFVCSGTLAWPLQNRMGAASKTGFPWVWLRTLIKLPQSAMTNYWSEGVKGYGSLQRADSLSDAQETGICDVEKL